MASYVASKRYYEGIAATVSEKDQQHTPLANAAHVSGQSIEQTARAFGRSVSRVAKQVRDAQTLTASKDHDMLDDLIDIQENINAIRNPLGGLTSALLDPTSNQNVYNPKDFKEKPFPNTHRCLRIGAQDASVCSACLDVCPVDAIDIQKNAVIISDQCRQCGLCCPVCPTETFSTRRHMPRQLYDQIARVASSYEECYITCTRALGKLPKPNQVVLPCVGMISKSLWFALLAEYRNISVYLPLDICTKCRTTTGEAVLVDAISTAETWAKTTVNVVIDESEMNHQLSRAYRRSQFISSAAQSAERLLSRTNPMLAGARAVAEKIKQHTQQVDELHRKIEAAVGAKTSANRQRILTQAKKLQLSGLEHIPQLAKSIELEVPVWDRAACTMCERCTEACTLNAIDIDMDGMISIQPSYCTGCAACVKVCEPDALEMQPYVFDDGQTLSSGLQ